MDENRITGAAKEFGGKAEGAAGKLTGDEKTQADGKKAELKGAAENLVGQTKDAARGFTDQVGDLAQDALKAGRESFPEAERTYRQGSEAVRGYAKESPLALALMAGAIGYVLALLIHGRR